MLKAGDMVWFNVGQNNQTYGIVLGTKDYGYVTNKRITKLARIFFFKIGRFWPRHVSAAYGYADSRNAWDNDHGWSSRKFKNDVNVYYKVYCDNEKFSQFKVISRA